MKNDIFVNDVDDEDEDEISETQLTPIISEDGKVLTIYLYDVVSRESLIPIIDHIMFANAQRGRTAPVRVDEDGLDEEESDYTKLTHINLMISSPGGDLDACSQLITAIDMSAVPIRTIAWGSVMSAGLMIFMSGHQRLVSPHTIFMSHHASYGSGSRMIHNMDKSTSNMARAIHTLCMNMYLKYTKKTTAYINRHLLPRTRDDVYFVGGDAVRHGIADGVFNDWEQLSESFQR